MFCPECGTFIKKGLFICPNCKFRIKLRTEIEREKDKKEINDNKTKKIDEDKTKIVKKVEKRKETKKKTTVKDVKNLIEEPKSPLAQKDKDTKSKIKEKVGLMFDRLIDSSFQKET